MSKENLLLTDEEIVKVSGEAYIRAIRMGYMDFRAEFEARKAVVVAQRTVILKELKKVEEGKPSLIVRLARLQHLIARMEQP